MKAWRIKLHQFTSSIDAMFFIRYVVAFALIFSALGFIVIQILMQTAYSSTDKKIEQLANDPNLLYQVYMDNIENGGSGNSAGRLDMNVQIIFWNNAGEQLVSPLQSTQSQANQMFTNLKFSKNNLDSIVNMQVKNDYGNASSFRSLTEKFVVSSDIKTNISYYQILINTNQVKESVERFKGIILYTMVVFWLISIVISWFLTKMSMKPILKNWEKQRAFISNASHELRTPLAILQNRLERLFQKPDSTILDNSENIADSLNEVRNMRFLTSNLLNLAKNEKEQLEVKPEEIDQAFFNKMAINYSELAELEKRQFQSDISEIKNFKQDKQVLKQMITILFDNAMKYTSDNGLIEFVVTQSKRDVTISIKDDGIGISDPDKVKIFERFYRVDQARTRNNGGLGLGLSLLEQLVGILKGQVNVYDNFPKGTVFKLTVPNMERSKLH
ncbi:MULTISPECIES: ATP-binding protein [unclassified Enterococcus]|uniref:sensor histidine kinase n=1 Tax=unclassified Enterococcus TaxID=2608891 RepID=UPI0015575D1B|nr:MULTISPECIES: ATP-binding protein [unclassified Enterococcus]MBS7577909.1 HAMP domain-containing histidine kinase [Enterococcus sp. MMGLQ5-2]MBS7585230.1 HAMP domain-containing histidine kinase [Enterococcus sp. MMGLQ5-1]NPD13087.1 HAMP domain-containing histidine kinase [Enterococcus sp. MMGLQ5-1]NPD37739.1 HAMP domain-containing histidine kinase [Enterococcus sp. MMGLQ5-2]